MQDRLKPATYRVTIELIDKPLLASNSGRAKGQFVFARDKKGNVIIEDHRIKSFFGEAAKALFYNEPDVLEKVNFNVFVKNAQVDPPKPPDDTLRRPVVARTPGMSRASIITSEALNPGTKIRFDVEVIPADALDADTLQTLLRFGERIGLGQWRKAGYGRFKVVAFRRIDDKEGK